MICPVCNKEINKPLHITKSKDDDHKKFVIEQQLLAEKLLLNGMPLVNIQNNKDIIIKSNITDFLYMKHKDFLLEIGRKNRNERISKSKMKINSLDNNRKIKHEKAINGIKDINYVECKICGYCGINLSTHIKRIHKLGGAEYHKLYPNSNIISKILRDSYKNKLKNENPNDNPNSISKMKDTKAQTKDERSLKAKLQFLNGERKIPINNGRGLGGIRRDLHNQYFRSMWEANFARILELKNFQYEYEKTVPLYDNNNQLIMSYCVDFYLPKFDSYIEIKGKWEDIAREKINLFKQQYTNKFVIIEGEQYRKIESIYKSKIKLWEDNKQNIKIIPELYK